MAYTPHVTEVDKVVQIGLETTPGTAVAANRRIRSWGLDLEISAAYTKHKAAGSRFNTNVIPGKEFVDTPVAGIMEYGELGYILASILGAPTTAQQGTTAAYLHEWTPSDTVPADPRTYTIECGSADRAAKAAYCVFADWGFSTSRDEIPLTGRIFGQLYTDGITLTSSPTLLARKPIVPNQVKLYSAAVAASPSFTLLAECPNITFASTGWWAPWWAVDATNTSFDDAVPMAPEITLSAVLEANAAGMAFLADARIMTRRILRYEAIGPTISGSYTYKFVMDMAGDVSNVTGPNDNDGVRAVTFDFTPAYDSTWTKAIDIDLINELATLA